MNAASDRPENRVADLLAAADQALLPPPATPRTPAQLDALLARRRRRDLVRAGGVATFAAAAAALLWPGPAVDPALARDSAASASVASPVVLAAAEFDRRLRRLAAELGQLRAQCAVTTMPLADAKSDWALAREEERAAAAAVAVAEQLAVADPDRAARQRDRVLRLWPDTAAARRLTDPPTEEPR